MSEPTWSVRATANICDRSIRWVNAKIHELGIGEQGTTCKCCSYKHSTSWTLTESDIQLLKSERKWRKTPND